MAAKAAIDRAAQIVGQIDSHDVDEARRKIAEDEALLARQQPKPPLTWPGKDATGQERGN
jgi:hypothetical protein